MFKIYTSGGIQRRRDGGRRWRVLLDKFARRCKLDIEFVHPPDTVNPDFSLHTDNQLLYDNPTAWYKKHESVELEDLRRVRESDANVFYYDGNTGFGTDREFLEAYNGNKPIYFIRTVPKTSVQHWVMWRVLHLKDTSPDRLRTFTSLPEFRDFLKVHFPAGGKKP